MASKDKKQDYPSFSPTQIKHLRKGLRKYRKLNNYSWMQVTFDFLECGSNDYVRPIIQLEKDDKEDKHWPIKEKRISRFAGPEKVKIEDKKILHAIRSFLKENGLWKSRYDEKSGDDFDEALELAHYFFPNKEIKPWNGLDLTGKFQMETIGQERNENRSLNFDLFDHGLYYEIEERVSTKTSEGLYQSHKTGWANITSFKGLLMFLHNQDNGEKEIYMGQSLKIFKDRSVEIKLQPFNSMPFSDKTAKVTELKKPEARKGVKSLCFFKEFSEESEELKIRGLPAIDWEKVAEEQRRKTNKVGKESLEVQYLSGCFEGDLEAVEDAVNKGVDIKCRTKGTNESALHLAAGERHRHIVEFLVTLPDIDFLAKDHEGELASSIAGVRGDDAELSDFLTDFEMKQADRENRVYLDILMDRENTSESGPDSPEVK